MDKDSYGWLVPILSAVTMLALWFGYTHESLRESDTWDLRTTRGDSADDESASVSNRSMHSSAARILWLAACVVLLATMAWNVLLSAAIIAKSRFWKHGLGGTRAFVFLVILFVVFAPLKLIYDMDTTGELGSKLLQFGFESTGTNLTGPTRIHNTIAYASVAIIVIACAFLTVRTETEDHDQLRELVADYRLSLYSSACFLTVAIFEVYTLFRFAVALSPDTSVITLPNSIALSLGMFYTAVLAAVYLPVAVAQDRWVTELTLACPTDRKRSDWLEAKGVMASPLSVLGHYVAVLAPLIMGIFAKSL